MSPRNALSLRGYLARGDYFDTWQLQFAFAVIASAVLALTWIYLRTPLVPILIPLAVLSIVLAITKPYLVCVIFLTMTYFKLPEISPVLAPLNHGLSALSILVSFALVWHGLLERTVQPTIATLQTMLLSFWAIISIGSLFAYDHTIAYRGWSDLSKVIFLSWAIPLFFREERHFRTLTRLFVFGGVVIALSCVFHYYTQEDLVEGTRAAGGEGTLANPNDFALLLLLPLSFAGSSFLMGSRFTERAWNLGVVVLIVTAILFTQSRGGLLGVVAVLTVLGSRFVKSKVLLIFCGLALGGFLYHASNLSDREQISGNSSIIGDKSAQIRTYAWRAGTNMALHYPLTGVGIGNFSVQYWQYTPVHTHHAYTAHSIWFLVLGETGFPGFFTFVGIIITCFRVNISSARRLGAVPVSAEVRALAPGLIAAFGGFCVAGSFLSYAYQWPLYVLIGFTVSLARLANQTPPALNE